MKEATEGSANFWNTIKIVTKTKGKKEKIIGPLKNDDGELIFNDSEKAGLMNELFANIGEKLAKNLDEIENSPIEYVHRVTPTTGHIDITEKAVAEKLRKLNARKACGPDEITTRELKTASEELSFPIANICRMGYTEGKYPSKWKIGKLKPAHKQGERAERGNYRPLTMLSIPRKISESVICDGMEKQIDRTRHRNQWAYSKGKSMESVLLYLTETWKRHMSEGEVVGVLFIDFRKAFDCIDHVILKQKLIAAGVTGQLYLLIKSYLENRQQYVELNGVTSELKTVAYGVPQGSLLGPRLFSVYMNDLPDITSTGEIHLYADDVTAFVNGKSVDECVCKLNDLAKEINNWCVTNKMTVNVDKTEAMIMKRKRFPGPLTPIKIGKRMVEYKDVSKVLGVYIDNKINWNAHINKVYKKYSGMIAIRPVSYLPKHLKKSIIKW